METTSSKGLSIEHIQWGAAPLHIPNPEGGAYKTELVIHRSAESTEKINWWHEPDPRRDPHSHPWPFRSTILAGGYTETRFTKMVNGDWVKGTFSYKKGDINNVPAGVYHTVDSVEPGTVTHMVCGALTAGPLDWGHLITDTKEVPVEHDHDFIVRLKGINPHKR